MKVIAVVSFVSRIEGLVYRVREGDEMELPRGADWLGAGLVKKVDTGEKRRRSRRAPMKGGSKIPRRTSLRQAQGEQE